MYVGGTTRGKNANEKRGGRLRRDGGNRGKGGSQTVGSAAGGENQQPREGEAGENPAIEIY